MKLSLKGQASCSAAEERVIPQLTCEGIKEREREASEDLET